MILLVWLCLCGLAAAQIAISELLNQTNADFNSTLAFNAALMAAINATAHASDCNSCFKLLSILKPVAEMGEAPFAQLSVAYCQALLHKDPDWCAGLETLEAPSMSFALRSMTIPSRTAQLFCWSLYGLCDQPSPIEYQVTFPKPKPSHAKRPSPSGKEPTEVVHISDWHVDHGYTAGSSYNCTKSVCCHPYNETFAAGSELAQSYPARPFGEYTCDSPVELEEALHNAIREIVPNRAFLISTGDMIAGTEWMTTRISVASDITDIYSRMRDRLGLVFPAIGNHDANPVNSYPPAGVSTPYSNVYDYNLHSILWEPWIGAEAAEQIRSQHAAYHTTYGRLHIISINTMLWMGVNWWIYQTEMPRDPSGVFEFIVSKLQMAEDKGEPAWIIGHIPPGRRDALYDYSSYFDQIVLRYEATIAAMFWGHTHQDQLEISYSDYGNQTRDNAKVVGYIAPSLTPTSGNPSLRVYSVDPIAFAVLDYVVYYANLSASGYHERGPEFKKYYSVKEAYGGLLDPPMIDAREELTPAFWHDVTALFEKDDAVFQEWYIRKQRGWKTARCDGDCKAVEMCRLRSSQSQYGCHQPQAALKKRGKDGSMNDHRAEDECSHSRMVEVARAMLEDAEGMKVRLQTLLEA